MKKRAVSLFLILLIPIFLVGCGNQVTPNLEGTSWKLNTYLNNSGHLVSPIANTKATLEFKDGRISGASGCNTFFANYTLNGKFISFGLIGSTKMACKNPGVMEQEKTYLNNLSLVKSYKFEGNKLILIDDKGKTILTYTKN